MASCSFCVCSSCHCSCHNAGFSSCNGDSDPFYPPMSRFSSSGDTKDSCSCDRLDANAGLSARFSDQFFTPRARFSDQFFTPRARFSDQFYTPRATFSGEFHTPRSTFSGEFHTPRSTFSDEFHTPRSTFSSRSDPNPNAGEALVNEAPVDEAAIVKHVVYLWSLSLSYFIAMAGLIIFFNNAKNWIAETREKNNLAPIFSLAYLFHFCFVYGIGRLALRDIAKHCVLDCFVLIGACTVMSFMTCLIIGSSVSMLFAYKSAGTLAAQWILCGSILFVTRWNTLVARWNTFVAGWNTLVA